MNEPNRTRNTRGRDVRVLAVYAALLFLVVAAAAHLWRLAASGAPEQRPMNVILEPPADEAAEPAREDRHE